MTALTPEAALGLATQHLQGGNLAAAEAIYRSVLAQNPKDAEALYGLSAVAHHMGHPDALALMEKSVALRPDHAESLLNFGNLLQNAGRLPEAVNAFRRAMALAPDMPEAYNSLGSAMAAMGRPDDAVPAYEVAVRLRPQSALMMSNMGNAYFDLGRVDKAIECHSRAVAIDPTYAEGYNNRAVARQELGQFDLAILDEQLAISIRPAYPEAHQNLGLLLLMRGDFAAGWPEYEWRWKRADLPGPRNLPAKAWDGSAGSGTILVHAEQGFGDTLQFSRYIPRVRELGWRVILECIDGQELLFADSAARLGIEQVISRPLALQGKPLAPVGVSYDVHVPMLSLPLVLRDYDPASAAIAKPPYLVVNSERRERWRQDERVKSARGLKVGLVWAGRPQHRADKKRSMPLAECKPLAMEGVTLYSLMVGGTSPAWGSASGPDVPMPIVDLGGDLRDFADTAAVLAELDLLIAVDTAAAHLAGALGRPTWLLLSKVPDFRWLLDRSDTPWYPTMRLYRQATRGDWPGVIRRVAGDLAAMAGSRGTDGQIEGTQRGDSASAALQLSDPSQGSLPELSCRN